MRFIETDDHWNPQNHWFSPAIYISLFLSAINSLTWYSSHLVLHLLRETLETFILFRTHRSTGKGRTTPVGGGVPSNPPMRIHSRNTSWNVTASSLAVMWIFFLVCLSFRFFQCFNNLVLCVYYYSWNATGKPLHYLYCSAFLSSGLCRSCLYAQS